MSSPNLHAEALTSSPPLPSTVSSVFGDGTFKEVAERDTVD